MLLSAHQPAYLPWPGYFDKIARSDLFVYLDSVQYEKNSFINRNRIKTSQGSHWLTIPVATKGHFSSTLAHTLIDSNAAWRRKHVKALEHAYSKAPAYGQFMPFVSQLISSEELNLSDYLYHHLISWCCLLGIGTPIIRASTLSLSGSKSDLILDLCRQLGASRYLSGVHGRSYLSADDFTASGIEIDYQDYAPPVYAQLWGDFLPGLSMVDLCMNGVSWPC